MPKVKNQQFNCAAATERMHEFLDGELPDDLFAAMEKHLKDCSECASVLRQLQQIEAAHRQLDSQAELPPENYWQALPERVTERIEMAGPQRRPYLRGIFALPRKSRSVTVTTNPLPSIINPADGQLHLPPRVRAFINGPGKYALALAAVAAFCFFMVRELREKTTPLSTAQPALESELPSARSAHDVALEGPSPISIKHTPEEPPARLSGSTELAEVSPKSEKTASVSRSEQPAPQTTERYKAVTGAGNEEHLAKNEQTRRGQETPVAIPSQQEQPAALALAEKSQDDASRESQASAESTTPVKSPPLDTSSRQAVGLSLQAQIAEVRGEPSVPASLQSERRGVIISEKAEQTAPAEPNIRATAAPKASTRAYSSTAAKREAVSLEASYFNKMLSKAEQTSDLSEREKIWRNFLTVQPDSTYRALAVFHLAQTLATASDSSTSSARIEQNLIFFRDNARLIRPLMGRKDFERELERLQGLLKWRQSSTSPKP